MSRKLITVDGNEAAASVAFRVSETTAIFPITPSSPMAELCDEWASRGKTNIWGTIPEDPREPVKSRPRRSTARRVTSRRTSDYLHRVSGPAPDDPEHVQD